VLLCYEEKINQQEATLTQKNIAAAPAPKEEKKEEEESSCELM
jgi:hypothetical protein